LTREAGFSLIELLVTLFLASMMLTLMTGFFQANVVTRQKMSLQTEVQQGLRALFEMVTQELRQAGACLPQQGQFIALDGSDGGDQDSLTLRIGKTDPDTLVCAKAGTTADAASGETVLTVAPGDGDLFAEAKLVYVTPNGANGAFYPVASTTSTSITLDEGLAGAHPAGTGIYAVDERVYTVETGSSGRPVLTVSIDGGSSVPLVDGVEEFNVQYRKDPCPPCDEVDEPADDTEWRQVREVVITATVRSHKEDRDGELTREGGYVHVKPRNLL
jgi:prepilin-type N-terminal cleavage/methylation domain-containing protein